MLNEISKEKTLKCFINDYTKIKDEFKEFLKSENLFWQFQWEREHFHGSEGVWLNHSTGILIRIRWGKVNSSAFIYTNIEILDKIKKFLTNYQFVDGFSSPNEDYLFLNDIDVVNKAIERQEIIDSKELSEDSSEFLYKLNEKINVYKNLFNVRFSEIIKEDDTNNFNGLHIILKTGKEFVLEIKE